MSFFGDFATGALDGFNQNVGPSLLSQAFKSGQEKKKKKQLGQSVSKLRTAYETGAPIDYNDYDEDAVSAFSNQLKLEKDLKDAGKRSMDYDSQRKKFGPKAKYSVDEYGNTSVSGYGEDEDGEPGLYFNDPGAESPPGLMEALGGLAGPSLAENSFGVASPVASKKGFFGGLSSFLGKGLENKDKYVRPAFFPSPEEIPEALSVQPPESAVQEAVQKQQERKQIDPNKAMKAKQILLQNGKSATPQDIQNFLMRNPGL